MAYGMILGQTPNPDIPIGGIILWSGAQNAIPTNWNLCDGTNGTPDLRGQFVIGAGGSYNVGNTGGESEHTLTVNEMPSHNHTFTGNSHTHSLNLEGLTTSSNGAHTHTFQSENGWKPFNDLNHIGDGIGYSLNFYSYGNYNPIQSAGKHTHTISGSGTIDSTVATGTISNVGGSQPHNNLPPYYALCYIMKIA